MSQSSSNEAEKSVTTAAETESEAPSAANTPVAPKAAKTSHSASWLAWLLIIILFIAIGAAVWFGYKHVLPMHQQHQQALERLRLDQQATEDELARVRQALNETSTQLDAQLNSALNEQDKRLKRTLAAQQSQLADYRLAVDSVQAELANLDMSQESNWRIFEAHELAGRAASKLWIEHDANAALAFLRLAQSHLVALNNPAYMAARQALANDIATLEQLPETQITAVSLQLGTLRERIRGSQWYQQLAMNGDTQEVPSEDNWLANLRRSGNTLLQQFVRVQRRDTPVEPMIADTYFDVVQQRLLLQLQLAQQAALQGEQALYSATIEEAIEQLRVLEGQITDTGVTEVIAQLSTLRAVTLRPEYPTELSVTSQLERLVRQQSQGG